MLAAELKQNNYPNTANFAEKLKKLDLNCNENIACTPKTIQRDIKTLKEEFAAPIAYDSEIKGYYLKHHGWSFQCPIFEEQELVAAILGARLAEEIFPDPLKHDVREATDNLLTENNPDLLDSAVVNALTVISGLQVLIDPAVFRAIFEGWMKHEAVAITYKNASGTVSERTIEPHVLAYRDSSWFVKGYCRMRKEYRTFAVHRVNSAELSGGHFEPDLELIRAVRSGILFDYAKIKHITIHCDANIAPFAIEKRLHSHQKIEHLSDGSFLLHIPESTEYDITSWVLGQAGRARLKSPVKLKTKIAEIAKKIADSH